ncbi:potassium-transporting ATPase subunit KdpC [Gryllotalpicola protaetiae]|uniref:Potassium-transporting ATPase KdpC subunit n=1 Tax=Gryllotalpicola protaetiae TaxID=2419771 RepID=A0A387BHT3_9MICO|nr:potassium-transporting ATPase subunit KdpC [Gryllotalpicola protaetiae]AYG03383.1 potassium-transporting ATPase subunit KdpC [Gryllotalpicola protaetiae]
MPATTRAGVRQYWVAIRAMVVLTAALGIAYPLVITGIGQLGFHSQANGSQFQTDAGSGSTLIGQSFTDTKGKPLTQWFQTRPSAATSDAAPNGYDANASLGSNWGPNNPDLVKAIDERKKVIEQTYGVAASQIPVDALTASGSGLDPDISTDYARLQVAKVAATRGISAASVQKLVERNTHSRDLGYLGQSYVNVVQLNLDLSKMDPDGNK